jgi:hypothetical protein
MSTAVRDLRAFRYDPPGCAKQGARRTTFQSALEQCEQFQAAARDAGYATRPVQLFYTLSQAGRAIVAASPRIGNQAWRVSRHGLTVNTNTASTADVTVTATKSGLFPSVAAALDIEPLVPDEPTTLRELWPLLPDSAFVPLTVDATLPVLLFSPHSFAHTVVFTRAEIKGIPHRVKDLYGEDSVRLKQHLDRYPALREAWLLPPAAPGARLEWASAGPGLSLRVEWWSESPSFANSDKMFASSASKTINDLGVVSYKSADDFMITPPSAQCRPACIPSWRCGPYCWHCHRWHGTSRPLGLRYSTSTDPSRPMPSNTFLTRQSIPYPQP